MALPDRFWIKVNKNPSLNSCWLWVAGHHQKGYGLFKLDGKLYRAHKLAFLDAGGILTENKPHVLHKCHEYGFKDNPACVNPMHLKAGNDSENEKDYIKAGNHSSARKTHCPQNHLLFGDNLDPYELKHGKRKCKKCRNRRICDRINKIRALK